MCMAPVIARRYGETKMDLSVTDRDGVWNYKKKDRHNLKNRKHA